MTPFEKSGKFMYRNARPVDLARWQYHFENGSKENVVKILAEYQNEDGGFGHGLEEDCLEAGLEIMDMNEFRQKLIAQVKIELDACAEKWETDYVCMPSNFIKTKDSVFREDNTELIARECEFIKKAQLPDGSFVVPWEWWTEYKEFELAKNWWKAEICLRNMRFLRDFDRVAE